MMDQDSNLSSLPSSVAEVVFERKGGPDYHARIDGLEPGKYHLLLTFDGAAYPFERHCRYVRHLDGKLPYTFPNMEVAVEPPGIRVGPWPGWRGIPDMPEVKIGLGKTSKPVQFQWWGDELSCRHVRGSVEILVNRDAEFTVVTSDDRIVPLQAELFPSPVSNVKPMAVALREELAGEHPRLLFTGNEIPDLRARLETTHEHIWSRIEALMQSWNLPATKTPESKAVDGPERLFGEDRATIAAFRALLQPSVAHIEFAREAFFHYLKETQQEDFEPLRIDTQSGEVLFTLCICYDWLYPHLTPEEQKQSRQRLWEVADICWKHLGYERHDYAQAHFLGSGLGLLACAFLFWETHPRAKEWASYLRGTFNRVIAMLPNDGFYPHGINLWIYEYSFMLRWLELFRLCAGENLWGASPHWNNASLFRACSTSPDCLYGVTMGDPQFRVGGDSWCHYLIASRTRSEGAQWLANALADCPPAGVDYRHVPPRRRVFEFLYYDATVKTTPISKVIQHFEDGGQVFVRTLEGEPALFTFRSGPPIGQQRYKAGEQGAYGHSDPANGSFLIFRQHTFPISGPGPTYRRDTRLHNTITVDGQGQIGDSAVWLPDFFPPNVIPPCTKVKTDGKNTLLFANLTASYLPHLGVERCTRSMIVDLETAIIGVDTIVCSEEREIEWNLHTRGKMTDMSGNGHTAFLIGNGKGKIDVRMLSPQQCVWQTGNTEIVPAYPHDGRRDKFLRFSTWQRRVQFVWCISMRQGIHPQLYRYDENLMIKKAAGDTIHFDGTWLIPEGFNETEA